MQPSSPAATYSPNSSSSAEVYVSTGFKDGEMQKVVVTASFAKLRDAFEKLENNNRELLDIMDETLRPMENAFAELSKLRKTILEKDTEMLLQVSSNEELDGEVRDKAFDLREASVRANVSQLRVDTAVTSFMKEKQELRTMKSVAKKIRKTCESISEEDGVESMELKRLKGFSARNSKNMALTGLVLAKKLRSKRAASVVFEDDSAELEFAKESMLEHIKDDEVVAVYLDTIKKLKEAEVTAVEDVAATSLAFYNAAHRYETDEFICHELGLCTGLHSCTMEIQRRRHEENKVL